MPEDIAVETLVSLMSVVRVRLHCTHCGLERSYQPAENTPQQCPQCHVASKPQYAWLRSKIPYFPLLGWVILFPSLWIYDILTEGTSEHQVPWLPYLMTLAVFALVWMLATLFRNWPKTHMGLYIVPEIRWMREDASPEELIGSKIEVRLEENLPFRTRFTAIIEGAKTIRTDEDEDDDRAFWKDDRVYVLRPREDSSAGKAEQGPLLFHPEWVRFKRGKWNMLMKKYHGRFSYRPSMEELLLNPECLFREIWGRVWKDRIRNANLLAKSELSTSDLKVPDALGKITRS